MKPVKKLLVPVDFSISSVSVLRQAVQIAKASGAEIIIFHVYSRPIMSQKSGIGDELHKEKEQLKKLEEKIDYNFEMLLTLVPELRSLTTKFIRKLGTIVEETIKAVSENDVDLVLMGTRGARGLDEFWGTKAADVSMGIKIPVLIMPYESQIAKPAKIALACDFVKITDYTVLDKVKLFSDVYDAELDILNINGDETNEEEEKNILELKKYFDDLNHSLHIKKHDDIEEGIIDHIRQNNVSMLVLLHRSRNFFEKLFHDSITERMAYHSKIPVLVLRES